MRIEILAHDPTRPARSDRTRMPHPFKQRIDRQAQRGSETPRGEAGLTMGGGHTVGMIE